MESLEQLVELHCHDVTSSFEEDCDVSEEDGTVVDLVVLSLLELLSLTENKIC